MSWFGSLAEHDLTPASSRRGRWVSAVVWLILGLCLAGSFGAAAAWRSYLRTASKTEFDTRSTDLVASTESAVRRDTDFMAAMSATLSSQPEMDNADFATWLTSVGVSWRYAGGLGYVYIEKVQDTQLAAFEAELLADQPATAVRGSRVDLVPAGVRSEYCLTRLGDAAGQAGSRNVGPSVPLGYDYCATPGTTTAEGSQASDSLLATAAGTGFTVSSLAGHPDQFAIAAPVYRAGAALASPAERTGAQIGWAGGTFDSNAIVASGSGSHDGIRVEVLHRNFGGPLVQVAAEGSARSDGYVREAYLTADGGWVIRVTGRATSAAWSPDAQAGALLAASLGMTALLFGFVQLLSHSRRQALRTVDVTSDQLQQQSADLLVEKGLLTDVIASIPHLVYWKDLEGRYRGLNRAYLEQRGLEEEIEALGRSDAELGYHDDFLRVLAELEASVLASGAAELERHVTIMTVDGSPRSLLLSVLPQRGADGGMDGLIGVGADVTHISELERVLGQSNRLESIGQLAAGIAHEINTPVQFVSDNVRFLAESFGEILGVVRAIADVTSACESPGPELRKARAAVDAADLDFLVAEIPTAISESQEGLVRVSEIVRAMKDFSHPGVGRLDTDVNRAVESTVQVSRNEWKYVAEVQLDLDPAVGLLPCYEGELKQVVLNIIVNSAHAIGQRREQTGEAALGTIAVSTRRDADSVRIVVTDDGTGMSEETRRRIFDPFFTTKEVGKGTGQGLSLAHSTIVQKHGGRIDVQSAPGCGATFTLVLPTHVASPADAVTDAAPTPTQELLV